MHDVTRPSRPLFACCALVLLAALARAGAAGDSPAATAPAALDARSAFEKLKGLVGTWTGSTRGPDGESMEIKVVYRLSAAGSVLVETLFPGTEHEMVTVYHMDGEDLVLTHYCAAGNQPRMKAAATGEPDTIRFEFAGGSNLDAARDTHMHEASLRLVDGKRLHAQWSGWSGGKLAEVKEFDLVRR